MQHQGVNRARQRAARGDQLSGHHHEQDDADKVIGARRQEQQ
jgi:hypothetical protein